MIALISLASVGTIGGNRTGRNYTSKKHGPLFRAGGFRSKRQPVMILARRLVMAGAPALLPEKTAFAAAAEREGDERDAEQDGKALNHAASLAQGRRRREGAARAATPAVMPGRRLAAGPEKRPMIAHYHRPHQPRR
jgi:hypothetical protein